MMRNDNKGSVSSRDLMTKPTKLRKVEKFLKGFSSKLRARTDLHSGVHLLESMLVVTASLVERKESM